MEYHEEFLSSFQPLCSLLIISTCKRFNNFAPDYYILILGGCPECFLDAFRFCCIFVQGVNNVASVLVYFHTW